MARRDTQKTSMARPVRVRVSLTSEELSALDDFRFGRRMPSRAAAARETY
jgi:hypothetical protein